MRLSRLRAFSLSAVAVAAFAGVLSRGDAAGPAIEAGTRPSFTEVRSSVKEFQELFALIRSTLSHNEVTFQGKTGTVSGFAAGTAYPQIWIRDSATILPASRLLYDAPYLKSWLEELLAFQAADGQLEDWFDSRGKTDKNTTETDQETSAVRAAVQIAGILGPGWLSETIQGESVLSRLERALRYVLDHRFDKDHGMITGAHTADWGDVDMAFPDQRAIYVDRNTHRTCDIYDQAQFYGAAMELSRIFEETKQPEKAANWRKSADAVRESADRWLWMEDKGYYRVHIHLDMLRHDFDEDAIFAMGGNAEAAISGLASDGHTGRIIRTALDRQKHYGLSTVSGTLLPPYPKGFFKHPMMDNPYEYQNGGQWDWFGGKLVYAMFAHGNSRLAREKLLEIARKDIASRGLYEWDTPDGQGRGSAFYSGSAGSLALALFEGYFGLGVAKSGLVIAPRLGGDQASVRAVFPGAGSFVSYDYRCDPTKGLITLRINSDLNSPGFIRVILPSLPDGPPTPEEMGKIVVLLDGKKTAFQPFALNDDRGVAVATDFRDRTLEVRYFRPIE